MGVTYGTQGSGLSDAQQAYVDKLMTAELAQKTVFDRFATLRKELPQRNSQKIEFKRWIPMKDLMFVNDIYKNYTGNTDGEGIATLIPENAYQDFILSEGSSGDEKGAMQVVKTEAEVIPIGAWMTYTEELELFHDMYTISENVKQYSDVASLVIDGFYRDFMVNGAGHLQDITGNTDPEDKIESESFAKAIRKIGLQLRLSGAKYVNSIISATPKYGTIPVWSRYIGIVNPLAGDKLKDNEKFIPLEKYATGSVKPLDGEIGMIGDVRVIENENMSISATDTDGLYTGEMLIMGKDHTAQIPLRGKKRVQVIVKPIGGSDKSDALNRFGTIGWKSWIGAKVLYPERLGVIKFNFTID